MTIAGFQNLNKPGALRQRTFWIVTALMLAIMGTVQITSIREETQTWDEAMHLAAGLSYWRTGDYRMNQEHPVLPKLLCAVPLLFVPGMKLPTDHPAWKDSDQINFSQQFLYANTISSERILFPARCVTIALTLALGVLLAAWVRFRFGDLPALLALALYVFDPNIVAHGRYITTDLWAAAFVFLAAITWCEALIRRTPKWYVLAGIALGLALGSKFSAVFMVPAFLVVALIRRPTWSAVFIVPVVAAVTLAIPYAPEIKSYAISVATKQPIAEPYLSMPLAVTTDNKTYVGERLRDLGTALNLPNFAYLVGLAKVADHVKGGHWAYLMGKATEEGGWWYYFPIAFAVKTPLAVLALTLLAIGLVLWKRPSFRFEILAIAVPFVICWGFALSSKLNLGVRHILPVYPLLYVMVAVAAVRFAPRFIWAAAVLFLIVESALIYPHYLAFFNWSVGGADRGPEYLVDSNIDWGQDSKKLKRWLDENHIDGQVCLSYFGQAWPKLWGVNEAYLPKYNEQKLRDEMDCVAAASVTILYGDYSPNDDLRYLRALKPMAKVGYSIYLYDLRKSARSR